MISSVKRNRHIYLTNVADSYIKNLFGIVCAYFFQGLKYRRSVAGKTAVFNSEEVILEETDWYLLDLFRLWWRYGISFIRLQMWVEEIMEKFMR